MDIRDKNRMLIDRRISEGLSFLQKHYTVEKCASDEAIASPRVGGRLHEAVRYDIKGVGNLLTMTCKETDENNLSSFVIMPYAKNLPLISSDYVYSLEKRYFLLEVYDLSVRHDEVYDKGIGNFAKLGEKLTALKDIPTQPCWYDDIRPVCCSKAPGLDQDDLSVSGFMEFLKLFVEMEQATPFLSGDDLVQKWKINREYADRLIDEGGVSTDLFTEALGAENTRRFFHELFFGSENYRPEGL